MKQNFNNKKKKQRKMLHTEFHEQSGKYKDGNLNERRN